ncbi:hypothetical protein [Bradyrhizobium lablabi]|uniref:hypothetical protein n=1 Tax=Bradyrhizobium lablabi TaxID=722472 RepID=UPI001BA45EFC|nr:hypothetical protein [Bradyrhizobium lablabi]MBR0693603.1 hypothetical protein [Bradyrhizobium lablabi]
MVAYSFRRRFVDPIRSGAKRQTIRAVGKRRHARPGETVQLYSGMRTKQCIKIGDARCIYVQPMWIGVRNDSFSLRDIVIDADAFARADGFTSISDMHAFWLREHGVGNFEMLLIKWEPL